MYECDAEGAYFCFLVGKNNLQGNDVMNHSTFRTSGAANESLCCIAAVVGMTMMGNGSTLAALRKQLHPNVFTGASTRLQLLAPRPFVLRLLVPRDRTAPLVPLPPVRTSTPKAALDEAQRALKLGRS